MPLDQRTKVAIVGFCNSSREMTPYGDPTFEVWGLNRGYLFMPRADRWFDLHGRDVLFMQARRPGKHVQWLKDFKGPVYVHQRFEELGDNQVEFPLQAVAEDLFGPARRHSQPGTAQCEMAAGGLWRVGPHKDRCPAEGCKDHDHSSSGPGDACACACHGETVWQDMTSAPYISSSIAFELALAIHEGFREIHLYGVDLNTESEYAWQKPGVEFLIGLAAGRGIKVVLPDNCPLATGTLYGRGFVSDAPQEHAYSQFESRMKSLQHDGEAISVQLAHANGARRELEYLMAQAIPGVDHMAVEAAYENAGKHIVKLGSQAIALEGSLNETQRWFADRLAKIKAELKRQDQTLADAMGGRTGVMEVQKLMPNGLNHERLDDRRKKFEAHINEVSATKLALEGAIQETAYWLSQTMAGQDPVEAIAQLRALAPVDLDAEGPVTDLQQLHSEFADYTPIPLVGGD